MSKFDDLHAKYRGKITGPMMVKLYDGDLTSTKKYVEYLFKSWVANRGTPYCKNANDLIELVRNFDDLLPYIPVEEKDIYSRQYMNTAHLYKIVEDALILKSEKTFKREDHIEVIFENEDLLIIHPKTLEGSLKYGANTKWCTASRSQPGIFRNYRNKYLVYVISKKETKKSSFNKIAFITVNNNLLTPQIEVYSALDSRIHDDAVLIQSGWKWEELQLISLYYKDYLYKSKLVKIHGNIIQSQINLMRSVNIAELERSIEFLKNRTGLDDTENRQEIKNFVNKMNEFISYVDELKAEQQIVFQKNNGNKVYTY